MITEFTDQAPSDAHNRFQEWRRTNPNGFFLNQQSPNVAMRHHVECSHLGDMEWESSDYSKSLTKTSKICSTNPEDLLAWASERGLSVKDCNDCIA